MMMRSWINMVTENFSEKPWIMGGDSQRLIVYHGTSTRRVHDMNDGEADYITEFSDEVYFASTIEEAKSYCGHSGFPQIYKAHIWMKTPLRTTDYDMFAEAAHILPDLKARGYDGVIFGDNDQFFVFGSDQIELLGLV